MKRFFIAFVCAVALFASAPAQAAPILVTDTNDVVGTVVFDLAFTPVFYAVSGASTATIVDGVPVNAGIIDTLGDPDSAAFVDLGLDDIYAFDFIFATSVFDFDAEVWSLIVNGTPLFATDPALLAFAGDNLGRFTLLGVLPILEPETQQALGFIGTFALDSIASQEDVTAVPEPATLTLVGLGLAAAARRRAKKNIQAA